jgi:hypothetical protein
LEQGRYSQVEDLLNRQGTIMAEGQGEALATIGEIAQGHGDIRAAVSAARRGPLERYSGLGSTKSTMR